MFWQYSQPPQLSRKNTYLYHIYNSDSNWQCSMDSPETTAHKRTSNIHFGFIPDWCCMNRWGLIILCTDGRSVSRFMTLPVWAVQWLYLILPYPTQLLNALGSLRWIASPRTWDLPPSICSRCMSERSLPRWLSSCAEIPMAVPWSNELKQEHTACFV